MSYLFFLLAVRIIAVRTGTVNPRTDVVRTNGESASPNQLPPNPLRNLRNNGISGSESLCKVGLIQSEAKPIILRRSLPLSHLIPSVRVSDESGTAHSDLGGGSVGQ
jgi:hypothetical protein